MNAINSTTKQEPMQVQRDFRKKYEITRGQHAHTTLYGISAYTVRLSEGENSVRTIARRGTLGIAATIEDKGAYDLPHLSSAEVIAEHIQRNIPDASLEVIIQATKLIQEAIESDRQQYLFLHYPDPMVTEEWVSVQETVATGTVNINLQDHTLIYSTDCDYFPAYINFNPTLEYNTLPPIDLTDPTVTGESIIKTIMNWDKTADSLGMVTSLTYHALRAYLTALPASSNTDIYTVSKLLYET